jgi:predicted dehydrogenase
MSHTINELVESGVIGTPVVLSANLGYPNSQKARLRDPAMAGGALLDVGVYPINFASMIFGTQIESVVSSCIRLDTGVDAQNSIVITLAGGRQAVLHSSMLARTDRQGIISGDRGHLIVENINNPASVTVVDNDYRTVARYDAPPQITGFEYQVQASIDAVREGRIESPFMPHAETLRIMRLMDSLRREWGVCYPFE